MAAIRSYPLGAPTLNDTVLGVQYVENQEPATKQYKINEIIALAEVPAPSPYTPPYYTYVALVTQIGASDIVSISDNDLTIGVTYSIDTQTLEPPYTYDFTNVGAPNNNNGTYFVATGTTPNSWQPGMQLNYDLGAPTVTVLENTIGNVWYTYDDIGTYSVHSNGAFAADKTTVSIDAYLQGNPTYKILYGTVAPLSFAIYIDKNGANIDDGLSKTRLEIKLYKPAI